MTEVCDEMTIVQLPDGRCTEAAVMKAIARMREISWNCRIDEVHIPPSVEKPSLCSSCYREWLNEWMKIRVVSADVVIGAIQ